MSYSLDDFCADARAILGEQDNHEGRDRIRQNLERLLRDRAFCSAYVGPDNEAGVRQIHEDPDYRFCVLAYNMVEPRKSPPHDHGGSWAVYGQAAGHTDMTVWAETEEGDGGIRPLRTFRLEAGQAGLFDVGEIHSIDYPAGAKFVRVTGVDLSREARRVFDPETGAVREVRHVGTGRA